MKRVVYMSVPFLLLIGAFLTVGFMDSVNIAFVDTREIIAESDAGKDASAKLEGFIESKKKEIESQRQELVDFKKDYDSTVEKLSEKEKEAKAQTFLKQQREFEQFVARARNEISRKDQELTQTLVPEVDRIIRKMAYSNGYLMVVDVNTGRVIYHSKKKDITSNVLDEFNKRYNVGEIEIEDLN